MSESCLADLGDVLATTTTASTVLTGEVADQAALMGLLSRLRDHGLVITEVRRLVEEAGEQRTISSSQDDASSSTREHRDFVRNCPAAPDRIDRQGSAMTATLDQMGPVDYVVVEFPGNRMTGEAFPLLVDLVDRGIIRIIDLAFMRKELDGSITSMNVQDLEAMNMLEFALFEGAGSGLLDQDDLDEAAKALEPNSSAGILVYENVWAAPFAAAVRRSGGQLIASGRIPIQAILAALDAAEAPWPPSEQHVGRS